MDLVYALLIGLIAGWLAGLIRGGGGYGVIGNMVIGVVGSVIGHFLVGVLGAFGGRERDREEQVQAVAIRRLWRCSRGGRGSVRLPRSRS